MGGEHNLFAECDGVVARAARQVYKRSSTGNMSPPNDTLVRRTDGPRPRDGACGITGDDVYPACDARLHPLIANGTHTHCGARCELLRNCVFYFVGVRGSSGIDVVPSTI